MSEINCLNCAISDFKESLCHRCDEMKRLGNAYDIEGLLIKAFSEVDSPAKSDCISRQSAIDALDCINGVEEVLRSLPSAQPEIIMCKKCIWFDRYTDGIEKYQWDGFCANWARNTYENWYCSRAERRTDGTDARSDIG